jgi:hypothetical protein
MIGSFLYSSTPRPDDVTVWLQRQHDRAPTARIILPPRLTELLVEQNYPPPAPVMSIESALCYAVFLAMRSHAAMVISGDRAAWNAEWGYLTDLSQFPTSGLVAEGNRASRD